MIGSCSSTSEERRRSEVEQGLRPAHALANDLGWSMAERMKHYGVPGASVAVVSQGKLVWTGYYGTTDKVAGKQVNATTLFQAASISKPITAYGVLKLAEQDELELDSNVNRLLTSWQLEENEFTKEQSVTLRHLLSHTGGISIHGFLGYQRGEPIPTLHQILDSDDPANSWVVRPIQKVGEGFRYSGGGYCIVQQLLIDQRKMDFPTLMAELVLNPLMMNNSTFTQPASDSILANAASGYLPNGSLVEGRRHIYPEMAAAGLWTTAEDLARFGLALQSRYPEEPAALHMLTPFYEEVGLGMFLDDREGEWYFQHAGWNEGFSSKLIFGRDRDYGVVVMINANQPDFIEEVIRSVAAAYAWHNYLPPVYEELALEKQETDQIIGRYAYSKDQVVSVFSRSDSLYLSYLNEEPQLLVRVGPNLFLRREKEYLVRFGMDSLQTYQLSFELPQARENASDFFIKLNAAEKVPFDHILEGNWKRAHQAYAELDKKHPSDPDLREYRFYQRAERLKDQKNLRAAVELLKINTELHPGSATAFHRLADAYLEVHDAEEALRNYKKSVKFYPQNEEAQKMIEKLEVPKGEI